MELFPVDEVIVNSMGEHLFRLFIYLVVFVNLEKIHLSHQDYVIMSYLYMCNAFTTTLKNRVGKIFEHFRKRTLIITKTAFIIKKCIIYCQKLFDSKLCVM